MMHAEETSYPSRTRNMELSGRGIHHAPMPAHVCQQDLQGYPYFCCHFGDMYTVYCIPSPSTRIHTSIASPFRQTVVSANSIHNAPERLSFTPLPTQKRRAFEALSQQQHQWSHPIRYPLYGRIKLLSFLALILRCIYKYCRHK
jgi:hypothetical protein